MIHNVLTLISTMALILLLVPITRWGMLIGIPIFLATAILLIKNKPKDRNDRIPKSTVISTLLLLLPFGVLFFIQWMPSYIVGQVAQMLHLPVAVLVVTAAVSLWLCAVYAASGLIHRARTRTGTRSGKGFFAADIAICLILAALSVMFAQTMIDVPVLYMGIGRFLWGTFAVFVLILTIYTLTRKINAAAFLGMGLILIISTVNMYVLKFRDRLFEPVDLFSFGTAMNVVGNYELLPVSPAVMKAWRVWALLFLGLSVVSVKNRKSILPGKKRCILAICCLTGILTVSFYVKNLKVYHWNMEGAYFNGYVLDFISKLKEIKVPEPEGYGEDLIAELAEEWTQDTDSTLQKDAPHIIVIMDEAFSDLNVLGEVQTNMEVMPFFSSLKADTVSGYALASVYGGNTANSEYEFLTGNTMAWLSENAVPYQQYIRSPAYSMVSYLKTTYDYHCIAMHPYYSSGWNRPAVYKHFGFDEMLFEEDFQQKQYIRGFFSDQKMFEKVVEVYEHNREQPLFLFGVSMQNHGDYKYSGADFEQYVSLTGCHGSYSDVEQYLTLIHETDQALEYLISYFENVDDDVIVVFFGDHQPILDASFYEEISQRDSNSLEARQRKYLVPFCIWANYDIDEMYLERTSLNYLSSYVYDAAGIPLPPYNRALKEIEAAVPAINANGFYSPASSGYVSFDMASEEEQKWLLLYEQLQYNSLFDAKYRNQKLFPVLQ